MDASEDSLNLEDDLKHQVEQTVLPESDVFDEIPD
jgi:hypothetical protein